MAAGYRYVLWDHDGVLVDTEPLYFSATRRSVAQFGLHVSRAAYLDLQARGGRLWALAAALGVADSALASARQERDRRYQTLLSREQIDIPGVEEVLTRLASRVRMAIVTTSKRRDFELIHRNRSLTDHMAFVLCVEDYPRSKPHPDPYLAGVTRFGAGRDEVLVVEDSERGLRSAVAAGLDCAVVDSPFTSGQDFSSATYRIGSIGELEAIV